MNVLKIAFTLVIWLAVTAPVFADESLRLPGLREFGIAPAPSTLVDGQARTVAEVKPLEAVIDMIRHRLPGRALGARLVEWQGREAYEIRWIGDNGVVRDITADAVSGEILDER